MSVLLPTGLDEALHLLAQLDSALVLAGGTDLMVEVNYGRLSPGAVLSLRGVDELRGWRRDGDSVVMGAGLRYSEMLDAEFAAVAPALAQAARTVGSPQIRNAGTVGGNIATASPAGDALPPLYALDAVVGVASVRGQRAVPIADLIVGPKQTTLADDELIVSVTVPAAAGPQEFLKVGTRNAMVISVASMALVVDLGARTVAGALGSVGPTVLRCREAEAMAAREVDWRRGRIRDPRAYETFGAMCAAAARPIDDHRSSAAYRRHSIAVLGRRALMRAL